MSMLLGNTTDPRECNRRAGERGLRAWAMQNGNECWGTNAVVGAIRHGKAAGSCDSRGSGWVNNIRVRDTRRDGVAHIGCFADRSQRAMSVMLGRLPIERCAATARERQFRFVGMQAGSECWASNSLTDATRYGSSGRMCEPDGGPWINSVYQVL